MYYHVTDAGLVDQILREGLIAQPVVYLAISYLDAQSIRRSQIRNGERFGPSQTFCVLGRYDLLVDPNVRKTPYGFVAFMVYQDIHPSSLRLVYG